MDTKVNVKRILVIVLLIVLIPNVIRVYTEWKEKKVGQAEQLRASPPDNSVNIDKYIEQGISSLDAKWQSTDFVKASEIILALSSRDYTTLPRYHSMKSGDLFSKIVSKDNFPDLIDQGVSTSERFETTIDVYTAIGSLLLAYKADSDSIFFDPELLSISTLKLDLFPIALNNIETLLDELRGGTNEEFYLKDIEELHARFVGIPITTIEYVNVLNNIDDDEMLRVIVHLNRSIPKIIRMIPADNGMFLVKALYGMWPETTNPIVNSKLSILRGDIARLYYEKEAGKAESQSNKAL